MHDACGCFLPALLLYEYDSETGLYHYRARAYSPALGRFLQPDPISFSGGGY